jgi:hypothetical protein
MTYPDFPSAGSSRREAKAFPLGYLIATAVLIVLAVALSQAAPQSVPQQQSVSVPQQGGYEHVDPEQLAGGKRLAEAKLVLQAGLSGMDSGIRQDLLDRADCVGVFPNVLKVAFVFGGQYGKGVISCRSIGQTWSSPASFRIEGCNVGLQIGGSATDFVLLFIGPRSVNKLLRTKFTLGVDAAAAAGPAGRGARPATVRAPPVHEPPRHCTDTVWRCSDRTRYTYNAPAAFAASPPCRTPAQLPRED